MPLLKMIHRKEHCHAQEEIACNSLGTWHNRLAVPGEFLPATRICALCFNDNLRSILSCSQLRFVFRAAKMTVGITTGVQIKALCFGSALKL